MFKVQSRFADPRLMPVSVNADGSLLIPNNHLSVTKNGTGDYTIAVERSFQNTPFAFPTVRKDGVSRAYATIDRANFSTKNVRIKTYDLSDVAKDANFDVMLFGSDGGLPHYNVIPTNVRTPVLSPRMLLFYYDGANDVMSPGYDVHRGTMVKTGTGLYTLTLRQPFFNTVYVGAITNSLTRGVEIGTKDNKTITFETYNTSGAAAADTELFIWVIGSYSRGTGGRQLNELLAPQPFLFMNPFEYNGSTDAMVRGGQYIAKSKASTTYTFTPQRQSKRAMFALSVADGANLTAINNRTAASFKMDVDADTRVFGMEIGSRAGIL